MTHLFGAIAALIACVWPGSLQAADPAAGQSVFKTQCGACHSVVQGKNMVGPSLFGLLGRKSGIVEGFRYSTANKAADLTWSAFTLDKYLSAPREAIPGTTMIYAGVKDETKRADLIAYLESIQ
ncbi:MAG: cytochrome c family protein [Acetobacteraceae bacterium]|nr:cytochrome c family protein [Acetobacteraceae bacterium]